MRKEIFLKKLGNQIKKIRQEKNMSQAALAMKCDKDPQSVERVENGKTNPSAYYLHEIANALDVPVKKIFEIE